MVVKDLEQLKEKLIQQRREIFYRLQNLVEVSFGGAESKAVLDYIEKLGEEEWTADRLARKLSKHIYSLESELNPIDIIFNEKILLTLGSVANEAESAGDMLRMMIVK